MSDVLDRSITVTEIAAMGQPIDVSSETTAAFVGRALRGPVNIPVLVHGYGDFRRRFGGEWARSSLGLAVRSFFDHGGRKLFVVRVANGARGAMLCLPARGSALVLRAVEPGSTERIRAAVDFDRIDPGNHELFNLTLQRIDPTTGLVTDQEIFRGTSYREDAEAFVGKLLATSLLARVERPFPTHRPERTIGANARYESTYVGHAQDGTDGTALSDYDLIGSRSDGTGLFALQQVGHFDILYLPPPGKLRDVGPAAILAAELYCRRRGAMLVVDPVAAWLKPDDVVKGVRDKGYRSPNMISYFPRVLIRDDQDREARVAGGAVAGLLCKLDRQHGSYSDLEQQNDGFNRRILPVIDVADDDAGILIRAGVNVIATGTAGRARLKGSVTMGRGSESHRHFSNLRVRRFCLKVINAIDRSTRWAVFVHDDVHLAERLKGQILGYLRCLSDRGVFASKKFVVMCDAGLCKRANRLEHGVTILLVFHPLGCTEPLAFTLHQTVAGCRVTTTAFAPVLEDCA